MKAGLKQVGAGGAVSKDPTCCLKDGVKSGCIHSLDCHPIAGGQYPACCYCGLTKSGAPPCRAPPDASDILSTLTQIFKQVTLRIGGHIPPRSDFTTGAMTTEAITSHRIDLADRNAR